MALKVFCREKKYLDIKDEDDANNELFHDFLHISIDCPSGFLNSERC